jgi:hypothetical protein
MELALRVVFEILMIIIRLLLPDWPWSWPL